jgi:hypothetical protein
MVSTIDVPVQPQPEVRCYAVEVRPCQRCGAKVRGRHSDAAPGQNRATAHRIRPQVKALAHILHMGAGTEDARHPEDLRGIWPGKWVMPVPADREYRA